MAVDSERLEQLERKIQNLQDRQDILDCIAKNARGCDRHDVDMLASTYHEDGIDEHGAAFTMLGSKYPEWANTVHSQGSIQNLHNLTTHHCEIDGDTAHAESYVIGLFFNADGKTGRLLAGRYIDKLERRDGEWRIVLRRCTVEVGMTSDAAFMNAPYFRDMGFLKGLRNKNDVWYQRPLTTDETPEGHRWEPALNDDQ
jgi:hypothetical protein